MTDVIRFAVSRSWRTKFMDEGELSAEGYVQEANRRFFHPLGLSLGLWETGEERVLKVSDRCDHPRGILYARSSPMREGRPRRDARSSRT